jgi:hypothetical protein
MAWHDYQVSRKSLRLRLTKLEERAKSERRALKMQAKEYERRLLDLNHAHEKQVTDQATYISEDKFIGWQGEVNAWRDRVTKTLSELEGRSGGIGSARQLMFQVLPLLISAVTLLALFLRK